MASHPEPFLTPTPAPGAAPLAPQPQAGMAPITPVPVAEPTPPLPLPGRGHPVASVEIIGQPVQESGPIGALHLAEVIRYKDGTKPDIVGYDPEGNGFVHGNDRLFAETSLGSMTPEQYIAAGQARYHLPIEATPHQSLDEFVAHQEHAWKMYNRSPGVPRYDFAGNDVTFHNSNSALVASIREAGRGDVANRLQRDLEPLAQMRALENGPDRLSPEAAAMKLALERRLEGAPSAPGASNELTPTQVEGLATAEPNAAREGHASREYSSAQEAARSLERDAKSYALNVEQSAANYLIAKVTQAERSLAHVTKETVDASQQQIKNSGFPTTRTPDMLDNAPERNGQYFTVMRTNEHGVQTLQRMRQPFEQDGRVISADADRVTQSIGHGTFTYKTEDLLYAARDPERILRTLEQAAEYHQTTSIKLGSRGLDVTTQSMEHVRGYEHGR